MYALIQENQFEGQIFPCKSFVYSNDKRECHLSAESGLITRVNNSRSPDEIDQKLSLFSSGQYFEKICLPGKNTPLIIRDIPFRIE
jgi:hypothetical protein